MNIREAKKLRNGDKVRRPSTNGHDNGWRVYAVSECSPAGFHTVDQHGYHSNVQFADSSAKAFLRECAVMTGKEPLTYREILDRDVPKIRDMAKRLACQGVVASIAIYYQHEAIAGESTALIGTLEDEGWKPTGVEIPGNVEYSQYWEYLYRRLGNVPLFA